MTVERLGQVAIPCLTAEPEDLSPAPLGWREPPSITPPRHHYFIWGLEDSEDWARASGCQLGCSPGVLAASSRGQGPLLMLCCCQLEILRFFFFFFLQEDLHFHFALDPRNYVASSPGCSG